MQKQEMTQLIDHDGDEIIDEYRVLTNDWKVSANFHEFGFGLAEKMIICMQRSRLELCQGELLQRINLPIAVRQ
jgi:hypothetical protein